MVTVGIDAHKSSLAVCLVDELGRELAAREFGNHPRAHAALHAWVVERAPGERRFGVESTSNAAAAKAAPDATPSAPSNATSPTSSTNNSEPTP
jgi:Transposase